MTRKFASLEDRDAIQAEMPWSDRDVPVTVYDQITRTRHLHGTRNAISYQMFADDGASAETLTWAEFHAKVTQAANMFRSLGVGEGDTVAYVLPTTNDTAITLFGAMTAGIVNPINPLLEPEKIAGILRETKAKVVVTLRSFPKTDVAQKVSEAVGYAPDVECVIEVDLNRYMTGLKKYIVPLIRPKNPVHHTARVLNFSAEMARHSDQRLTFDQSGEDRVCAYFHTGGTTGLPKVAQHKFSGLQYNGWVASQTMIGPEDVTLCPLPLFHVFAAYPVMMTAVHSGSHVVFPTPQGYRGDGVFDNFWKLVERWQASFIITVPTALSALMQRPVNADISSLRNGFSGSAALPRELFKRFEEATGVAIVEGYGLTEATCLVSANPPDGVKKVGSVGIPFPYCDVKILHRNPDGSVSKECGIDEVGEICVSNPGVWPGNTYTEAAKNKDLYDHEVYLRTGDLGRIDADGYLWITGRAKDLIIRGGHNIDPAMIEEALLSHPKVAFAGAIGQPDAVAGELPCAYVELIDGASATWRELLDHIDDRIPERAAIPKHIETVDELPKTAVGKVFKPDLRRMAITRVFDKAFQKAGLHASVVEVVEDKKRGLVAKIARGAEGEDDRIRDLLGDFTVQWDFA